jgi:putative sterol carrier protein
MSIEDVTKGMSERAGAKPAFGNSVKFQFAEGVIHVDGTGSGNNIVTNNDAPAQCTIKMSLDDFKAMAAGQLDGMTAFMTGKLKIEGDMGVAMKLQGLLRG